MPTIADLARAEQRVFPTHARVDRYYPAAASEEARTVLGRCLDRGEGPALLIGSPGTGKSMLLQVLAGDIGKNRPVVCLTSAQLCTRRALLQSILFELGQSYRQRDEGDLRLALMDFLSSGDVRTSGMLLLVDEAQSLPIRLLEELRILGNVAHQGVPVVRLLLAGSQPLEETFNEPEIEAFNQRIAARCYLAPLSHHETAQMVRGHLAAAGVNPDKMFTADALDAVYRASDGIARLVNQICDRALVLAADHGDMQVGKQTVQGAWADLQQLPTPWNLPDTPEMVSAPAHEEDVVEYGPLSDDDNEYELADPEVLTTQFATPAARLHQPQDDLHDVIAEESAEQTVEPSFAAELELEADVVEELELQPATSLVAVETATAPAPEPTPSMDDLFGDEFEEEVVIDEYASLEQAIPASRPRVTSACDADLGQLLSKVTETSEIEAEPAPATTSIVITPIAAKVETETKTADLQLDSTDEVQEPVAEPVAEIEEEEAEVEVSTPFAGFSVVEADSLDDEELAVDMTELDDETEEQLFDQVTEMAEDAERAAQPEDELGPTCEDILVVEEDMSLPIESAAAHRADYRQLFKTLRYNN